jgi:hypothetical protein
MPTGMRASFPIGVLAGAAIAVLLTAAATASAQRPTLEGAAGAGTGASFGKGDGATVVLLSPAFVDIDIIVGNDERPVLEYVVGFQAELQDRVSAGIIPQIRLTSGPSKLAFYGLLGAPFVFAPFRLFGVEAGGGLLWQFLPSFGMFFEVVIDLFFLGNDLPEDAALVQLDGTLGLRIMFL